jgi:tryptophanyl-tRNA synthetase
MEDMRNEAAKNAVEKDRTKNALEMLADGLSIEKVAQYSQLAIERVKELAIPKTAQ